MPFCSNCGTQVSEGTRFCPKCGTPIQQVTTSQQPTPPASEPVERAYFKGEGELVVKRTEHRGAARKAVSFLAGGPVGYVVFGRDKTAKTTAKGTLVVTNMAIYCAGNKYPFDRILSITKQGTISKSIVLTFEKDVGAGGRSEGGIMGVGGLSVEVELKTKDIDALFQALEQARMGTIQF